MSGTKRRKVETKVCFHIDDEETPYLVKLSIPIGRLTLRDFKRSIPKTNFKFFFKSEDPEFGVVKEEITNDSALLPAYNGRVVSWLVSEELTQDVSLEARESKQRASTMNRRSSNIYERIQSRERLCSVDSDTDSGSTELRNILEPSSPDNDPRQTSRPLDTVSTHRGGDYENYPTLEADGLFEPIEAASTIKIRDDSNLVLVDLTLPDSNTPLGLHFSAEGGHVIDYIIEDSVVSRDGRIDVGDELLSINDTPLQHLSSLEAVRVMRNITSTTREVNLLISKGLFGKAICPVDPAAWVAHSQAALQEGLEETWENDFAEIPTATVTAPIPAMELTPPATEHSWGVIEVNGESLEDALPQIARIMVRPNSGLEIKDRKWLSYHFRNAVVGSDVVDWLQCNTLCKRKQAKSLAEKMFKDGLIRNPVIKHRFNKKSIYTFCDQINELYQRFLDEQI